MVLRRLQRPSFAALIQRSKNNRGSRYPQQQGNFFWLHLVAPSFEEIQALAAVLPLNPLTQNDVTASTTAVQEKLLLFDDYIYLVMRELLQASLLLFPSPA